MMFVCELCGEEINPNDPYVWQAQHVWKRTAGQRLSGKRGGNDFRNAKPLQEWAHTDCLDREKRGLLAQEALV